MSIPFPILPDQSPNPSALFVYALLCSSIYHENPDGISEIGLVINAKVRATVIDLKAFAPDYTILWDGFTCLVVFDGTTNMAQWLGHSASALAPVIDPVLDEPVIASFFLGLAEVEGAVNNVINGLGARQIVVCGHSYGGACAYIFGRHRSKFTPQIPVYVLTFGEPKSYSAGAKGNMPTGHVRIVRWQSAGGLEVKFFSDFDPVTFMPPGQLEFFNFGRVFTASKLVAKLTPAHQGDEYLIDIYGKLTFNTASFLLKLPFVELLASADQIAYAPLHFMDSSYLVASRLSWVRTQKMDPQLQALWALSQSYIDGTTHLANNLTPPLPAETINEGFQLAAGTVTETNKWQFATVISSSHLDLLQEGVARMPITPYVAPTLKATSFFRMLNGGCSESFYAAPAASPPPVMPVPLKPIPTTYQQMMAAALIMAGFRQLLSNTPKSSPPATLVACTNPLILDAIRVENEQVSKASLLNTNPPANLFSYFNSVPLTTSQTNTIAGQLSVDNDALDSAFHVQLSDGNGHSAGFYMHGVPLVALSETTLQPGTLARADTYVQAFWTQQLNNYCNQMIINGLGFRFAYTTWTPLGVPVGGYPSLGNGTPMGCFYNFPMTPSNTYTFQMTGFGAAPGIPAQQLVPGTTPVTPSPPAIVGKFIAIVRSMKLLRVINGRWPATGFFYPGSSGPPVIPAGYYVNINRRAANYTVSTGNGYDNNGYLAPEVFSVVQPAPAPPVITSLPSGVQLLELTGKKMGRPFEEQRGRRRATVV